MRAIERRSDQRIHSGGDANVLYFALAFQLRHLREQHAGFGDEISTGLDPKREIWMRGFQCCQCSAEFRQHDTLLSQSLRNAKATTEIDGVNVREALRQSTQRLT